MKVRSWLFLLIVVSLALALVACGGNDSGNSGNSGGSSESDSGSSEVAAGDAAAGEELFNQVCIACHGEGGVGMEGLGKPFTTSDFIKGKSDAELLAFVKVGRPIGDPENTTNVDMPPKGGNPALSDEDLLDIIAYIRTVQE